MDDEELPPLPRSPSELPVPAGTLVLHTRLIGDLYPADL